MNSRAEERYHRPVSNVCEYVKRKNLRDRTAFINGKYILDGREYTIEEFNEAFPVIELQYDSIQLDGKQIKVN